jgi:bifunctional UDP-N-acetylglucosamine pyrophosphorylase/glucosamine-1-phosphate N-acetyltransferase
MSLRSSLTVVLAAGEGTRMHSSLPKVLHPVAGQSLLAHVLNAAPKSFEKNDMGKAPALAVVIGPSHEAVADEVARVRPDAVTFIQHQRLGTAHAVLAAREAIARGADDLLVVFGDTPLISAETLERLRAPLRDGAVVAVLGFQAADPTGYGRLLIEGGRLRGENRRLAASIILIEVPNMLPRYTATTLPSTGSKAPWVGEEIRTTMPRPKAS